jgi:hypothetical protein
MITQMKFIVPAGGLPSIVKRQIGAAGYLRLADHDTVVGSLHILCVGERQQCDNDACDDDVQQCIYVGSSLARVHSLYLAVAGAAAQQQRLQHIATVAILRADAVIACTHG